MSKAILNMRKVDDIIRIEGSQNRLLATIDINLVTFKEPVTAAELETITEVAGNFWNWHNNLIEEVPEMEGGPQ